MSTIISSLFLFLFLISANLLWKFNRTAYEEEQADRCLNRFCEDDGSFRRDVVHTSGLTFLKDKEGNLKVIKQVKPCDIGIL